MIDLRPYQNEIKGEVQEAYASGYKFPLVTMPTGAGKTVVFCAITEATKTKGKRTLINVHRRELLKQSSGALAKMGIAHTLIGPKFKPSYDQVYVASVDTLKGRLDQYPTPHLQIFDECHHLVPGNKWGKVAKHYQDKGAFGLGVTATPERLDGKGLGVDVGGFFDYLIEGPTMMDLIRMGYLAPYRVIRPDFFDYHQLDRVKVDNTGDYNKKEIAQLMSEPKIYGDAVKEYRKHADGLPAIAFCVNVDKAKQCSDAFSAAGYRAMHIDGTMSTPERDGAIEALSQGRIDVLTSCEIISEGTDIPVVTVGLGLRPTHSKNMHIQQMGRISRLYEGKTHAIWMDFVGNCMKLNCFPDTKHEWDLNKVKRSKKKKKEDEEEAALNYTACLNCLCQIRSNLKTCPECGEPQKITMRGEIKTDENAKLVEEENPEQRRLIEERIKKELERKKAINLRRQEQGRNRTLTQLYCYSYDKNYKLTYAENIYKSRGIVPEIFNSELIARSKKEFEIIKGVSFDEYQRKKRK